MTRPMISALCLVSMGLVALAACAPSASRNARTIPVQSGAAIPGGSPSEIVAAELRFARLAQNKGQWTAFRETAAENAYSFTPNLQRVDVWLKGRADPERAVTWQPHRIIISCDGSLAAATGAYQAPDGGTGYYTTIWQRQEKGDYKWVFDHASSTRPAQGNASTVTSERADCGKSPIGLDTAPQGAEQEVKGTARDGTLRWTAIQRADGSAVLSVRIFRDGEFVSMIDDQRGPSDGG